MKRVSPKGKHARTPLPKEIFPKVSGIKEAEYKEMVVGIISGRTDDLRTFHARGDREDCDKCIADSNRKTKASKGRGGVEGPLTPSLGCRPSDDPNFVQYRCSNCVRKHATCSWKRTLLIDGAVDYLKVSEEGAIALYEAWGKSCRPSVDHSHNFKRKRCIDSTASDVEDEEPDRQEKAGSSSTASPPAKRARRATLKQKQISFASVSKGGGKKNTLASSTIGPQSTETDERSNEEDQKDSSSTDKSVEMKQLWAEVERLKALVAKSKPQAGPSLQNMQREIRELRDALEEEQKTIEEQRQLLAAKDNDDTQSTKLLQDIFAKLGMWSFQLKNALEATPEHMQTRVREVLAGVDAAGIKCAFRDT